MAFFTTGLVETLFPRLNWQILFELPDEYYLRILTFAGILLIAMMPVVFSTLKQGKSPVRVMLLALSLFLPGLLIYFSGTGSEYKILFTALFLFTGSLLVQYSGLRSILPPEDNGKTAGLISGLYLIKTAGLMAGMGIPAFNSSPDRDPAFLLLTVCLSLTVISMLCQILLPSGEKQGKTGQFIFTIRELLRDKSVLMMIVGLILYSGTELCLAGFFPLYFSEVFGFNIFKTLVPGVGLFMLSFATGRLAGVWVLQKVRPVMVFLLSSILCILGLFTIFIGQKYLSIGALILAGLGLSNIFPVMLSLAVSKNQTGRYILPGLLLGTLPLGSFFPYLMWAAAGSISITMSLMVPVFCMFYITWSSIILLKYED